MLSPGITALALAPQGRPSRFPHPPDRQALSCPASPLPPRSREPPYLGPPSEHPQGACGPKPLLSSQFKPKRVGAGFPKGSCPLRTATELMAKTQASEQGAQPEPGGEPEPPSWPRSLRDEDRTELLPGPGGEVAGSGAHGGGPSPEKAARSPAAKARVSKKQQLLAAAALKDSQNISRFFCRRAESPPLLTPAAGAEGASASSEEVQGAPTTPEEHTGGEDGAVGHLAAHPRTEERATEGPR